MRQAHYLHEPLAVGSGEVVESQHVVREGQHHLVDVWQSDHVSDPRQLRTTTIHLQYTWSIEDIIYRWMIHVHVIPVVMI